MNDLFEKISDLDLQGVAIITVDRAGVVGYYGEGLTQDEIRNALTEVSDLFEMVGG